MNSEVALMGDKEINPIEFEEQHAKTAAFLGIDLYTWASLAVSSPRVAL